MPLAQDHKRAFDGDKGPNTGGMGAYTSLPFISDEDYRFALENVLQRTADAMVCEGFPLSGVLYGGLIKTDEGIKVIEFNARFGDPETEVVLPLLDSDIYEIFYAVASGGELPQPHWSDDVTLGVVMASKGYPGAYEKGFPITLPSDGGIIYHMGTTVRDGKFFTSGGRVLMCVARTSTLSQARSLAYRTVESVRCENLFYRKDIAHTALNE